MLTDSKRWHEHLFDHGASSPGAHHAADADFPGLLRGFLHWQSMQWQRLGAAIEELERVKTRDLDIGGSRVRLQWNPGRVTSTTAAIEDDAVRRRPCFLCPENLPFEEKGLPLGHDFVLLPNPAPILPLHFVAAHREHNPQNLDEALTAAIDLAARARGELTVFYNGRECGASAPDHVHLQAVASLHLPEEKKIVNELIREHPGQGSVVEAFAATGDVAIQPIRSAGRYYVALYGGAEAMVKGVRRCVESTRQVTGRAGEPPFNLLVRALGDGFAALFFPRGAHRPACFFEEGPGQCLISPGAVDMAGLVVTVREKDFQETGPERMKAIYQETSLTLEQQEAFDAALQSETS